MTIQSGNLIPTIFHKISELWGHPDIGLFASWLNNQVPRYVLWKVDPYAYVVDAFSLEWTDNYYAFPPFSVNGKVFRKIEQDSASGIVIAPFWTMQPWFSWFLHPFTDCPFLLLRDGVLTPPPHEISTKTSQDETSGMSGFRKLYEDKDLIM